jgi:hypothetical protein
MKVRVVKPTIGGWRPSVKNGGEIEGEIIF